MEFSSKKLTGNFIAKRRMWIDEHPLFDPPFLTQHKKGRQKKDVRLFIMTWLLPYVVGFEYEVLVRGFDTPKRG